MRRRTPALLTGALLSLTLVGGAVSPAIAAEPSGIDTTTTVQLEGDLLVLAGGDLERESRTPGTVSKSPSHHSDEVLLETAFGVMVELTGDVFDGAISGSTFSGTVSIPADVVEQVEEDVPDTDPIGPGDVVDGESELGEAIIAATVDLDTTLDVVDATVTEPKFDRAITPRAHTLDVAVLTLPGNQNEKVMTDAEITAMVNNFNTYWPTQTAGQVSRVTKPGAVQRIVTPTACDEMSAWNTAAPYFGASVNYYNGNAVSDHLMVIAPESCGGGTGLGSVGSLAAGGLIWVDALPSVTVQTLAHEFGHNLGLEHSNALLCEGNVSEGPDCYIEEYWDVFDIMGSGFYYEGMNGNVSNRQLMALNVTHKSALGALPSAALPSIALTNGAPYSSTAVALQPISATSGVRGIRVTDPVTGQVYFVEYRSGTGIDDGALYESGMFYGLGVGVRILKLESDGTSTVITRPAATLEQRNLFYTSGQTFTSRSGKLTIAVTGTGATASVTVTLGTKPTVAVSRLAGTSRYQTAVAISKQSFAGTAPVVYIATGMAFPDALAAAPAAAAQGGPLLLTDAKKLPIEVAAEIRRLKPGKIVVVGGPGAVSESVYNELAGMTTEIRRDAGIDRFATSRVIVEKAFPNGSDTAYVATALNFPDALAASAAAGSITAPVVLVNGKGSAVDADTRELLSALKVKKAFVAGGTGVVSTAVESSLKSFLANVTRLGGVTRYDTAVAINKSAFAASDTVYFANGDGFADALAGAALAGKNKTPLYTVKTECVPATVLAELARLKAKNVVLLGGAGVLTAKVVNMTACR